MGEVSGAEDFSTQLRQWVIDHESTVAGKRDVQQASVTFLGLEPIVVLRFSPLISTEPVVYCSVGASRYPMGDPEALTVDPIAGPRVEIIIRLTSTAQQTLAGIHRTVATLAAAPLVEGLVLVPDALVDLGEPLWQGTTKTAVLLTEDVVPHYVLAAPSEPVKFLRAIPVTSNEAAWVRLKGAKALQEVWAESKIDITEVNRAEGTF